ncbi:hypothetical protein Tel_00685 [Candidatus Tenderia electrophaga]|jgi:hypothetical protein|uniref:DNA gyrase inhibitor YacG n=1 Tax=Candidatus Tenderia electrophaga TaxID=1748243 RepID=A0A0S2T9A1_9GAMM|nr:hypothetical protein Tel_00685 [Candidatus Tenderia electrophaga]
MSEAPVVNCPSCGKQVVWEETSKWRPFCSERCKLIDLGEWASESHRIPGEELPATEENEDFLRNK